jgi:hypothetical protein
MESDTFRNQVAAIAAVTLNATATELVISSQQKRHDPMRRSFAFAAVAVVAAVCSMAQVRPDVPVAAADEEQAIRSFLARFYEGWNAHDVDKMVSIYADDNGGQLHQRRTAPSARPEVTDGGNADAIEWLFGVMLAVTHENPQRPAGWRHERAGRSTCEHWAS